MRSIYSFVKRFSFLTGALLMWAQLLSPLSLGAAATNLITNPSVETAASATTPTGWGTDKWGTNKTTFTYKQDEGHTGSKSLLVNMTSRSSGEAEWYFTTIPVKASQKYTYSEFYKSNVSSEIDIEYTNTSNKLSYKSLATPTASTAWKQAGATFTTPKNAKSLTIFHLINKVGSVQTDDFSLVEGEGTVTPPAPTAPTVTFTAPVNGSTVGGTQAVSANASDAVGVAGVQFKLDGTNLDVEDTSAPYSVNWDTKTAGNGTHTLTATARNASGLTSTATETVNVQNVTPTAPTVSFSSPANGATVSDIQAVTANASDTIGMVGVQFKVDGTALSSEDTTAPYSVNWDTKTVANGNHTLTATARNTSGLTATATVSINVNNVVTPPAPVPTPINLISNPSFENSANGTSPDNWLGGSSWGTNTSVFSYLNTGHTGSHSVKTEITSYTNGAANWYYANLPVTAGKTYKYENWYESNVDSEVDAEVTMNDGTVQYFYLSGAPANASWTKATATFTAPAGAKAITVYQILAKQGYIIADDYSLSEYTPTEFNRGLVTLNFDDGWRSIYTNGLPLLNKYGLVSTQYLNSEPIMGDYPDYMTYQQVKDFIAAGSEVGWHTRTHANLTTLSTSGMDTELTIPAAFLDGVGQPSSIFKNFATPYGAYNNTVVSEIKKYYRSHRSTDVGFNSKDNFDAYNIHVQNITNTTTPAQVQAWVNQAIAQKTWLVLVYHEVDTNPEDPTYAVTPANLDAELNLIKQSGATVKTMDAALDEISSQY